MSLYLKYRPKDFEALAGQDFVKKALTSAIENDRAVGAYIFTGPRGTGKTSSARIFAKAVNCLHPKNGNPCNECENCLAFESGKLIDIIEIDAASHTGVDNIREIISQAQYAPTMAKYKVYIIDEVHMLSKGAFNALLKTLEEPPSHAKFILATTEIHKVPETILSRCQRFDFKNITDSDIIARLEFVLSQEGVSYDDKALTLITKLADGALRNALSLTEQYIIDDELKSENIIQASGLASTENIKQIYEYLLSKDKQLLYLLETLTKEGTNIVFTYKDLIEEIRGKILNSEIPDNQMLIHIELLDYLYNTSLKLDKSYDPSTTLFVETLKFLQGYEENKKTNPIQNTTVKTKTVAAKNNTKTTQSKSQPIDENQDDNVDIADLQSLFSEEETPSQSLNTESKNQNSISADKPSIAKDTNSKTIGRDFDTTLFIKELKNLGSKAALNMSLRGASIQVKGNYLHIKSQSKIARNTFKLPENHAMMLEALTKVNADLEDIIVE